jgi:hypothetical protein
VDIEALKQALDRARHGMELNISGLLQALALEVWLRSLEHKQRRLRTQVLPHVA